MEPEGNNRRRTWAILFAILAVGLGLRVVYLLEARERPDFGRPTVDAAFHDYWARGLASGDWTPTEAFADPGVTTSPFFRPPGYPYLLAGVYRVFGDGYVAPRLFQMLLGLGSALLAFLWARRWLGPVPALLAALGMSIYWALIYFEAELQATALFVFLTLGFINLVDRWRLRGSVAAAAGAGVVAGLATLVRPNFLAIVAAALVWMVVVAASERRRALIAAAALLAGTLVAIAPATIRNYSVSGALIPVSANSGINLYIGNNPRADGFVASEIEGLGTFGTSFDWPRIVRALGTDDAGADRHFMRESFAFIGGNPWRFTQLTIKKALLFWGPAEVGHNKEVHYEREFSPLLGRLPGNFSFLLALGLAGFGLLVFGTNRERREPALLAGLATLAYFLSVLPFFAAARYRVPVVPFLLFFGSWALYRFGLAIRERRLGPAFAGFAIVAAIFFVAGRPLVDYAPSLARWHYDRAVAYEGIADPDRALEDYRASLREDPTFFYSRYNIGHLLASLGRHGDAVAQWEAALMARRNYAPTHYNLALSYLELGDAQRAAAHLERAVALQPESTVYRGKLVEIRGFLD